MVIWSYPFLSFVWFLSCVDPHVPDQVTSPTEVFATHTTHKLFLSSVYSLYVFITVILLCKCLPTLITFVWLLSCVDPHVSNQVVSVTHFLATHTTYKLFLSSVYSLYVCSEVTLLAECFTACVTLVWFFSSMCSHVLSEAESVSK